MTRNGRGRGGRTLRPEPVDLDAAAAELILHLSSEERGKADQPWPDGRTVSATRSDIWGDNRVIALAEGWLLIEGARHGYVCVTPPGPSVAPDLAEPLAVFAAINAIAPGGTWEGVPDLNGDAPPDAVF